MNSVVSSWRVCAAQDNRGLLVYFDPYLEDISIRQLTAPERADRLDKSVSVSALVEGEHATLFDEGVIDEQHRRFLEQVGD